MGAVIKKSEVAKLYPRRDLNSHKGQNGRLLIIGGSIEYYGAPILAGLGALGSGCDLVYLLVPECNFEVTRSFYPDFIVQRYPGNYVNSRTLDHLNELLGKVDCVLVGPGVSEQEESLRVITKIIQKAPCPVVLDAEAIPALAQLGLPDTDTSLRFVITPNHAEMDELLPGPLPEDENEKIRVVGDFATKWNVTILLKGPTDLIVSPEQQARLNVTGNAGMTTGGSGDVLAGFTASLIAQHVEPYAACLCASFILGAAGDNLHRQKGFNFMATDLALELPYAIHQTVS